MNKKLFFALAATVGLFASCSSDDISQAPSLGINDNEAAAIQINVGALTRGTGTVGSTNANAGANVWANQTFNLFMFDKGTFNLATKEGKDANDAPIDVPIFNNAVMTAPNGTGLANLILADGETTEYNVFPDGVFDFWAYRLDGAATGDPVGVDDENAEAVTIPFAIDGSQDVMYAEVTPTPGQEEVSADKIYSAYAARRGVQPSLNFKHLLTRLTFKVKAMSKEVGNQADLLYLGDAAPEGYYRGFKITGISVKSKSVGTFTVATSDNTTPFITWDTEAPEVLMALKDQGEGVSKKEEGTWQEVTATINYQTGEITYNDYSDGTNEFPGDETLEVYPSDSRDSYTGLPTTAITTIKAIAEAKKTAIHVEADPDNDIEENWGAANTTVTAYLWKQTQAYEGNNVASPASEMQPLKPVIPEWNGVDASAGTAAHTDAVEQDMDADAYDGLDADFKGGDVDADGLEAATVQANDGKYYHNTVDGKYYMIVYTAATGATDGEPNTAKTDIGEALLVAPGEYSYEVTINYKRWKRTSSTAITEQPGTITKTIARGNNAKFNAATSYNIVISMYGDGDVSTDTQITPWTQDEEEINLSGE